MFSVEYVKLALSLLYIYIYMLLKLCSMSFDQIIYMCAFFIKIYVETRLYTFNHTSMCGFLFGLNQKMVHVVFIFIKTLFGFRK